MATRELVTLVTLSSRAPFLFLVPRYIETCSRPSLGTLVSNTVRNSRSVSTIIIKSSGPRELFVGQLSRERRVLSIVPLREIIERDFCANAIKVFAGGTYGKVCRFESDSLQAELVKNSVTMQKYRDFHEKFINKGTETNSARVQYRELN